MSARLHAIAGPMKNVSLHLRPGENVLGRALECDIVLPSPQVSKKHAVIMVRENSLEIVDSGSSNGTFVNGILAKRKAIKNGDKITIGPFIFELTVANRNVSRALAPLSVGSLALGGQSGSINQVPVAGEADFGAPDINLSAQTESKSLLAKLVRRFDDIVLPVVFEFNKTYDWLTIVVALFALFLVTNMGMTVYPLMDAAKESVMRETISKARYIAKQITYLNSSAVGESNEAKLDVSFTEIDVAVREALIVNLEGRILAPGGRLNEIYGDTIFLKYRDDLKKGDQKFWRTLVNRGSDGTITVLDPIMVLSRVKGMNVPGAISVVKYNTAGIALDASTVSVVYLEALVMSALIGVIFIYLLYHFSRNPIRVLNDDIDLVLKGNSSEVPKRFKFEVFDQLIDSVNAILSRIPKSDGEVVTADINADDAQAIADAIQISVESLGSKISAGVMLLDSEKRVKYLNPAFEEISGIHLSSAAGDVIENVCRDEALASLMRDLLERAPSAGTEGSTDDFEFGSGLHKMSCTSIANSRGQISAYVVFAQKAEV